MTTDGIDCSGLTWTAYRCAGVTLPRDTDQQRTVGEPVERDVLRPGDLLFFPRHVAVSLGGDWCIHADGGAGAVVVNSLDPASDRYSERLDDEFEAARRLLG
jgi:cell wall-associated NlpC family hydrolase